MAKKQAFSLNPDPTFTIAVKIPVAGGKTTAIDVTYKHMTRTEVDEYLERNKDRDDVESAMDIMAGWGLTEEFNQENVARLFENYGGSGRAVIQTYLREIWGAREGN